jgi:MarR family transcriptional regulator, organic hydroperoxide resistance regulator
MMNVAPSRDELPEHAESLAELLARANHLLAESFQQQVRWHGLSATEWRVLAALSQRDGVAMTELAEHVLFKQPTLTKAIDRMERAQLVQRRTPSEDRRRTLVHLSERGRRLAAPLLQRARQHGALVDLALGDAASRDLKAALLTLIDRVREMPREQRPPRSSQAADD